MLVLLKLGRWLLSKALVLCVVGGLAVGGFALWKYVTSAYQEDGIRIDELTELQERATEVYTELESAHVRLIELAEGVESARRKIEAANQVIKYLDGLLNRIERFITMSAKERAESERKLEEARQSRQEQTEIRKALVNEQSELRIRRITLSEEAKRIESRINELESVSQASTLIENVEASWRALKPYLLVALLAAVLLPALWKLFAFYLWAPLLSAFGPIRLEKESLMQPVRVGGGVSTQVSLNEGEALWVKEAYLQASDESLTRRTRLVLDWKIPATCLAAGLVEMIELKSGVNQRGFVTVSSQRRADLELGVVELPEGAKMVLRPSSLAGLVSRSGESVRIERRWRLFHPQAWLTFQFRYFVFRGPCALIVSGVRGVRFENLDTDDNKGRRSNQVATIGFTPDLGYGVARAETFWSYFRGFNPLFDDVFRGRGAFLCQEISEDEASRASRFWNGVWSGLLKVLGV